MKYSITVEGSGPFTYNTVTKTIHAPEGPTPQDWNDLWEGLDAWWQSSPADRMIIISIIHTVFWGVGIPAPPNCRLVHCTRSVHYYLDLEATDIISVDDYHFGSLSIGPLIMLMVDASRERRTSVNYLCIFKIKSLMAQTTKHTATLIHHGGIWEAWTASDVDGLVTSAKRLDFLDGKPSDEAQHRGMIELRDICATGISIEYWTKEVYHD